MFRRDLTKVRFTADDINNLSIPSTNLSTSKASAFSPIVMSKRDRIKQRIGHSLNSQPPMTSSPNPPG
eukprot:m.33091 g.33091  ORF g.33091 m.33091 type:complete len:68 (-) comp6431_c0_seq1:223-426(-)